MIPRIGPDGIYRYTNDLIKLHRHDCKGAPVDHRLGRVSTPINVKSFEAKLRHHPDVEFAKYIIDGLNHGFHIGVDESVELKPAKQNMQSATQNPAVIWDYLKTETEAGNILGPFPRDIAPRVHINRFGAIPKKHQPGKWRLITDLSYPQGSSINDTIDPDLCSLSYITVDQVAARAVALGKGAHIAKIDIKSAYRLIPVCPRDRQYLGMMWNNEVYVDGMLPFGLCSAPKIFIS